jgi:hypothetical protein
VTAAVAVRQLVGSLRGGALSSATSCAIAIELRACLVFATESLGSVARRSMQMS